MKKIKRYLNRFQRSLKYISLHPLTCNKKNQAYFRYFGFHLRQWLVSNHPQIYNWVGGLRFYAFIGEAGVVGNIYCGLDDFEEMSFLMHFLKENDLFVDIGANVGSYSMLAAGINQCRTLAIEPIPDTFVRLRRNIELNNLLDFVECKNIGLGQENGKLRFTQSLGTMNRVYKESDKKFDSILVEVITLDELLLESKLTFCQPSLIKIDSEGYELPILMGGTKWLSDPNLQAIIVELNGSGNKYGYTDKDVKALLSSFGFLPYFYDPWRRELKIGLNLVHGINTIFIRDFQTASSRVLVGKSFHVLNYTI